MKMYNAVVEVDSRAELGADAIDDLMEQLAPWHVALGMSPRGWLEVRVSVPAETVLQAVSTAVLVIEGSTGYPAVAAEVMTEDEFAAREGFTAEPDIVSSAEAAEILGVSRERVRQYANTGRLQEIPTAGRGKVFTRSSVTALACQERPSGRPAKKSPAKTA